jgi:hypothetical protein
MSEWWWIGNNLVGSGHGLTLRYYPSIHLEGLRKTTKILNQDSWLPGPRFEHRTSRIRSRSVSHSTTTFSSQVRMVRLFQLTSLESANCSVTITVFFNLSTATWMSVHFKPQTLNHSYLFNSGYKTEMMWHRASVTLFIAVGLHCDNGHSARNNISWRRFMHNYHGFVSYYFHMFKTKTLH